MKIESVTLVNFRKYDLKTFNFNKNHTIITGPNASGKSTILEAICLLGTTRSFRKGSDKDLILIGKDNYFVKGNFTTIAGKKEISVSYSNENKVVSKNRTPYKKMSFLLDEMKIVSFSPLDLNLINGTPQERRAFLNLLISQTDHNYVQSHNNYMRLLKERNAFLKSLLQTGKMNEVVLESITNQLICEGKKIIDYRNSIIKKINSLISSIYHSLSKKENEDIMIKYLCNVECDKYLNQIETSLKESIRRGTTLIGPHRDDFTIYLNGVNISSIGSQGQQRDAIISLKICVTKILYDYMHDYPILLLDDVFSELDPERQNNILNTLDAQIQTIITSASLTDIKKEIIEQAEIICLE